MKNSIIAIALFFSFITAFGQEAIQVSKTGKGDPILFLPGFTTPGSVWDETISNLNGRHENHVVTYAGFDGLAPIGTPWYAPIKEALIDYIRKENFDQLTVIGHSMGGNLAIDIAAELPDRIGQLILVESIPCMREVMMPGVPASALQYESPYNQQILNMTEDAFLQMAAGMSQNMTLDSAKAALITSWVLKADRETYVYGYTDLLKLDLRDQLTRIKTPTLILGASFPNKESVEATYKQQYANLNTKKIVVADNSKHFIMFDQPEWFYDKVNNFMTANGR